jgi:exosortase A
MKREPIPNILVPEFDGGSKLALRSWHIASLALAFALAAILVGYWRTGAAMVAIWARSDTFAHGFLVAPIALWLIWRSRDDLQQVAPRPSWWVIVPLSAAGAGWLLGELGTVNAVSQFSFVAMLVLAVPTVLGTRAAGRIAFPLFFLFFAVPVGEFLMPQLMEWTADITVLALRLSGIPVFREGQNFVIPSGSWSVVEACSGVRYLIASLVIGTLYAYLTYRSPMRRAAFIGFSILVPIAANWARAYMIVMIGHLSGNRLAVGVDHLIYGWLFFGLVIVMMFWIGARWRDDGPEASVGGSVTARSGPAASPGEFLLVVVMVAIAAVVWPLGSRLIERSDAASLPALTVPAPAALGAWRATDGGLTTWRPQFQNPSVELHETLQQGDTAVGLYVGYYRNQSFEQKLVSSDNVLVKSQDAWLRVGGASRLLDIAGQRVDARTAELRGPGGDRLVAWYWYWVDGRLTASDALAKAYIALARLTGRGDDSAIVIVYAKVGRPGDAEAALAAFLRDVGPPVEAMLSETRDRR